MKHLKILTIITFLWLIIINSGTLGVLDTELRLQMAHSWWTRTEEVQITPNMTPKIRGDIRFGVIGRDNKRYIAYEPGQSILMLPGDWLGTQLARAFPILEEQAWRELVVSFLIFIPINLAVVLSSYWLLRLFEFSPKISALASLVLLLGTTVLHYAQVHQQNNQILLLILLAYGGSLAFIKKQEYRWLFLSGLALGGSILIRITCIVHGFTIGLFLLGCLIHNQQNILKIIRSFGTWIVGILPFTLLGRILDWIRYGSFFASGKQVEKAQLQTDPLWEDLDALPDNYPFVTPPAEGIIGPLFSFHKSLFIYDPLLLPGLIIGAIKWRQLSFYLQWYLLVGILNLGLHLFIYSRFFEWGGDAAWAARYHVTSAHLIMIPLLGLLIQQLLANKIKRLKAWLIQGIIILAFLVQLASVTMHFNLEVDQNRFGSPGARLKFRLAQRFLNIACLIDDSVSSRCVENLGPNLKPYLTKHNNLYFFPFVLQRKAQTNPQLSPWADLILIAWIMLVIITFIVTITFWINQVFI